MATDGPHLFFFNRMQTMNQSNILPILAIHINASSDTKKSILACIH